MSIEVITEPYCSDFSILPVASVISILFNLEISFMSKKILAEEGLGYIFKFCTASVLFIEFRIGYSIL